jgi:hypothetical protein
MRIQFILIASLFTYTVLPAQLIYYDNTRIVYDLIDGGKCTEKPDFDVFQVGFVGYKELVRKGKISNHSILTLIDFRKSGNEKRMWVIDLVDKKILYNSLVAHGRNSGELYATKFSNTLNSNQSSLGFFLTGAIYSGKHGTSLKLHGLEKGVNDEAEQRAIVMHGAEYVSEKYIEKEGRLGRSLGCPAIPMELHEKIIGRLANGTCLFIYYPDREYLEKGILSRESKILTTTSLTSQ